MKHFEKTLSSKPVYDGRVVKLRLDTVELENGSTALREVIHHNGGVAVLALDGENNVMMVRQFRYPYAEVLLEIPAGKLEPGEDPAACGRRELEEEAGCVSGDYRFLAKAYPTPGYTDEILHLYVAKELTFTRQHLDRDEFLTLLKVPYEKALEMCMNGEIKDAKTLIAILMYHTRSIK